MWRLAPLVLAALVLSVQASQAASPRGSGLIAFSLRGRDDNDAIYVVRADGRGLRQLTRPQVRQGYGGDSGPVWSPDGRRVAFERDLPYWGSDRFHLHVIGANGRGERALTAGPYDVMPAWSPDSKRLAFVRLAIGDAVTVSSIFTLTLGGGTAELISGTADVSPAWSPDGRMISFARFVGGATQLFVADADGGEVRTLGLAGTQPAWSPDGRRLAFVSYADRNGRTCAGGSCAPNGEIYVAAADGSELRRVTRSKADDAHPTWSPDGRFLAFSSGYEVNGHAPWLLVAPVDGGRVKRVTRLAGVHDPAWGPTASG
jgi:Tol biopolymer transport system component